MILSKDLNNLLLNTKLMLFLEIDYEFSVKFSQFICSYQKKVNS
jgi:hypothetical protein